MTRRPALVIIALLLFRNSSYADKDENMNELAGAWDCVSAVNDGKKVDKETVNKLELRVTKEGGYKTTLGDQVLFDSSCKLDKSKKPRHIDMIATEGKTKGKAARGIYELLDDRLTLCYTMPGKDRPTEFKSDSDSGVTLAVWRRKKK